MAQELGRDLFPGFSPEAKEKLLGYHWPGNVRELKNVVERCVYRHDQDTPVEEIVFDPFTSPFRPRSGIAQEATANGGGATTPGPGPGTAAAVGPFPIDLRDTVQNYEIALIEQALAEAKHNQRKAAELLQVTYHQLRGYLKKYELLKKDE
jgi:psp operon transcriptional activator